MSSRSPNWNDLRIFLEVARSKTLAGAAAKLKLDQSTISRHIARLEMAIDAAVFERDRNGFHITARGSELLAHVEAMELNSLSINDIINGTNSSPSGTVRIATMEGIGSLYLSRQLTQFKLQQPLINVELVMSAQQVHVNLREADMFISFFPPVGRGLEVTPIGAFPLHLYASPAYLKRSGVPSCLDDLENHQFISYVEDTIQLDTVRWLNEVIACPRVAFRSSSMIAQLFSAIDGGGIVMLPSFSAAESFGLVPLLREAIDVKRTIWLTMRADLGYIPRIKVVISFLRECLQRDCPLPPGAYTGRGPEQYASDVR